MRFRQNTNGNAIYILGYLDYGVGNFPLYVPVFSDGINKIIWATIDHNEVLPFNAYEKINPKYPKYSFKVMIRDHVMDEDHPLEIWEFTRDTTYLDLLLRLFDWYKTNNRFSGKLALEIKFLFLNGNIVELLIDKVGNELGLELIPENELPLFKEKTSLNSLAFELDKIARKNRSKGLK